MQIVKRVGVLSAGKVFGAMYFCLGLLLIPMFALMGGLAMLGAQNQDKAAGALGAGMMVAMAVIAPVIYGVMGFIAGMLMALLYNFLTRFIGGLELEFAPLPASNEVMVPIPASGMQS